MDLRYDDEDLAVFLGAYRPLALDVLRVEARVVGRLDDAQPVGVDTSACLVCKRKEEML